MPKLLYYSICLLLILSCKQQSSPSHVSLRDSVLNIYLSSIDSTVGYDTTSSDFQMLRAYQRNDISYLSNYVNRRNEALFYAKQEEYKAYAVNPDSCVHLEPLDKSSYEEASRFTYSQSFCPFEVKVTVEKNGDSAHLHFILYKPVHDPAWDSSACQIRRQFSKALKAKEWNQIEEALRYADYWTLKREGNGHGLDGSTLEVEGYSHPKMKVPYPPRYHLVQRWLGRRNALYDAFALALKLSGDKEVCFDLN